MLEDPRMAPLPEGLSVVVPVYNSAETLAELVARLERVLPTLARDFELILVNDGSRDDSWAQIEALAPGRPWLRGIHLMRNYGQHNATLCGIQAARYATTVTLDDDLQHPPEEIGKLLDKLNEGFDVVYGIPNEPPHAWWRNLFSIVTKRMLAYVMGMRRLRDLAAFRAFRTHLRRAFERYQNPNVQIDVLLSWGTSRFASVKVDEQPRLAGRSNYNFFKLFQYTMVILTGFSTFPLRVTSMLGFLFTLLGVLVFLYVLAIYFLVGSIPGFPFLASIISLFSGTQLFALGIMGEYLARIFDRSMDRPAYVVGETTASARATAAQPAGPLQEHLPSAGPAEAGRLEESPITDRGRAAAG